MSSSSPPAPNAGTNRPAGGAAAATAAAPAPVSTPVLLNAMLRTAPKVSDLFFSPGRPPLVEVNGRLSQPVPGMRPLTPDDTRRIANDLIGNNEHALTTLR